MNKFEFLGLPGERWAFINTFADWLSALGTIAAVWVSLWLARRSTQPRARFYATYVFAITPGEPREAREEYMRFSIVNTGDRPIKITSISWSTGFFNWTWMPGILRKRWYYQMFGGGMREQVISSKLPIVLDQGEEASWYIDALAETDGENWVAHFASKLVPRVDKNLYSLRAHAYASTGHQFTAKPSEDLLKRLRAAAEKVERAENAKSVSKAVG